VKYAAAALAGLVLLLAVFAGAAGGLASTLPGAHGGSQPSQDAMTDIPADYLLLYQAAAATCPGLDWTTLAAIGKIESDHGRSTLPGVHSGQNSAGAMGVMQFLPATFAAIIARHPPPAGGASPPSPYNPQDAIYTAAAYLCDNGARDSRDLHGSLWTYNHSEDYIHAVLSQAARYQAAGGGDPGAGSPAAQTAVGYALSQLGQPYVWGGNGAVDGGFDCSGLTTAAYAAAGITLPRTAQTQYQAVPAVSAGQPLLPGDLVFYGTPGRIHHVGIYLGDGQMIDAPDIGQTVRVEPYRWAGDDFSRAGRPAP
jgi:cell wall-associated NlpC family hydrolase